MNITFYSKSESLSWESDHNNIFTATLSSCINLKCFGHVRDKTQLRYTADYWTRQEIKVFGEMLQKRIDSKAAKDEAHDEL